MLRKFLVPITVVATWALLSGFGPTGAGAALTAPRPVAQATDDIPPIVLDGGCGAWMDSPHYSVGAGGAIVKTRYSCDVGFSMTVLEATSVLYYCGSTKPGGSLEVGWTGTYGCSPVRTAFYTSDFVVGSGKIVTRYTPKIGESGSPHKGWYIACTQYRRTGVGSVIRVWSPAAHVSW